MERSLVFIKPEFVWNRNFIWEYFDAVLLPSFGPFERTKDRMLWHPPRELIEAHYAHLKGKYDFVLEDTIRGFMAGGLDLRVYQGRDGLIETTRDLIGNTDPVKAGEGTVRRVFSDDSLQRAIQERRAVHNVIHASGNVAEGEVEIARFAPYLGRLDFFRKS